MSASPATTVENWRGASMSGKHARERRPGAERVLRHGEGGAYGARHGE